jgi:CHAD domain-containing protein
MLRFDHSAHGLSPGNLLEASIGDWLEEASAMLGLLGRRRTLVVGSSMGGWIALEVAIRSQAKLKSLKIVSAKDSLPESADESILFRDIAREVVQARIRELREASHHLYFPFQIKELHELRILAKRLRYAVELFADCWERPADEIAKEIALLQTSLGEIQDRHVLGLWLGSRADRAETAGDLALAPAAGRALTRVKRDAARRTRAFLADHQTAPTSA